MDITAFSILGKAGIISGANITVTLPVGTDKTNLAPIIMHTGTSINPASGAAQNFTNSVTYTVTAADTTTKVYTVTVNIAANHNGGNSGGGGSTPIPIPIYKAFVSGVGTSETTLQVNVNANVGSAAVDLGTLAGDAFSSEKTAIITMPSIPGVNTYTLGIPTSSLAGSHGEGVLTFSTSTGSITIPGNMLSGINGKKAEITIGQGDMSSLPDEVKTAVGSRPLVQLALTLDGVRSEWNNPDASVTVSIPYTPTDEELSDREHIVIWYIDGSGKVVSVPNGHYDPATGTVTFITTHFSYYAVAYVHKTFGDLESAAWAKKPIEFLASKGILKGTSEKEYAPQSNITRADFLYFLIRTLGVDAKFNGNFDDISSDAYYCQEIGIAKKLGISNGTGSNKFSPGASITRQDMMVLTAHALEKFNKLKATGDTTVLDKFSDKGDVAGYALNSLATLVKEGLIAGSEDKLNPRAQTTRAEAAVFMYSIYNKY